MRLADFILSNSEAILVEWEAFARGIWPGESTDPATLRDHADEILHATGLDMKSSQTAAQQVAKSKGEGPDDRSREGVNRASVRHAVARVESKFELEAVIAEYRALRASVIRLWRASGPAVDLNDLDDMTRFNESIDQSLTEAARGFEARIEFNRKVLLDREQAARAEAEDANRAKDMFLATLSHEMRTPLNAIVGWVGILRAKRMKERPLDDDLLEGLDVIERNTRAQVQLIEEVLDVARIVSGKLRLEMAPCELEKLVQAGVDAVRPSAEARGIRLVAELDPEASQATCDVTRIQQVVWNLVSNAVKFTPKGGQVRVRLSRAGSCSQIEVSDDGRGMSADLVPFVFDRFRQADSSSRKKFGGLGLGLSIARHLVEMHGGTIEARSPGEGKGSTFVVRLPVRAVQVPINPETTAVGEKPQRLPPTRLDGLRILMVDDEADARRLLARVLAEAGAQVRSVGSAAEALAALAETGEAGKFEVLVSDLGMPDVDGYDLIHEVRRRGHDAKELPAIALTAFARKGDAQDALTAGFQVHIAKPVDPHELTGVIAGLCGRRV